MLQAYKNLPIWGKLVVWAIIIIILYFIYRKIKKIIDSKNYKATVAESQTALNQLANQGVKPSFGQAQYSSYANTLQEALEGCRAALNANTFWSTIQNIFGALKNEADIYALIKAYGVRTVDKCGYFTGDFEGDLSATLSNKLSGPEGVAIRHSLADVNAILKSKSISFSF